MPKATLGDLLPYLRRVCAVQEARDLADGELLRRFLDQRDDAAFAALVQRHGPMVLGVCQRVLGDVHSAEDSFQATFLVLVRRAASLGRQPLGGWLDAETGRPLRRVSVEETSGPLAVSPDGKTICAGYLNIVDVVSGKVRQLATGRSSLFCSIAFAPDGKVVAVGDVSNAPRLELFDVVTGKVQRTFEGIDGKVSAVAFSPASKVLASAHEDKTVRLWDVVTGKELRRFAGHAKEVWHVAFSPDGKALASVGEEGLIRLWDVATGQLLQRLKGDDRGERNVAFSPDGKLLASVGYTGAIRLWEPNTGKELRQWPTHYFVAHHLAFSPDGKVIATAGSGECAVRRWNVATGKEIRPITGHTGAIQSLHYTPDGKTIFSLGWDQRVMEWDAVSGRERDRLFAGQFKPAAASPLWRAFARGGDLAPDGKAVALVGYNYIGLEYKPDPAIHVCDTVTGEELQTLSGNTEGVGFTRFSPDSKLLASNSTDGIRLWDLANGKLQWHLKEKGRFEPPVFSANSKILAFVGIDKTIRLCESTTGKEIRRWDIQLNSVTNLAFSRDGASIVAVGSFERRSMIRMWSTASGNEVQRFGGPPTPGGFDTVDFSPNDRLLVAYGMERRNLANGGVEWMQKIHLLEVLSGQEISEFECPHAWAVSAFAPDGRTLATGGADSTILLWDVTGTAQAGKVKPSPLTAKDLNKLWPDLRGDAPAAHRAIWALALAPNQSLPFLEQQLRPATPGDAQQIAKHLADLGSERFAVRQKAALALDELGEAAEKAVRKALEGNITLEVRQRAELFLQKRAKEELRQLRAIETLEHIANAEARQVLETLAKESPNPRVVEGAVASLRRLGKRITGS